MILEEYFDRIYCINLDSRPDRWESSLLEFNKIGINKVHRFSAISNTDGAIGCRDSHLSIITEAKELGLEKILIFEDDFKFIEFDIEILNHSIQTLSKINWELFYLGLSIDPNTKLELVNDNLLKTFFAHTTHSYGVHSRSYDLILENLPKNNIVDVFYRKHITTRGNSYVINPMYSIQKENYSDITKNMVNYDWMVDKFNKCKVKNNILI